MQTSKMLPIQTILRYMPKKIDDRMLPLLPYTPQVMPPGVEMPIKHPRAKIDMLGPERIHNQLIYQQYGIITLGGGGLKGAHYDIIRDRINKYVNFERFFAIWRLDPPWKPISKRSQGKRMGGGKAKVHHYETPVRAGRVLVELGGIGEFYEIERALQTICSKMPLYCMPISQEIMDNLKKEKLAMDAANYNPFEYRDLVRRNFSNSKKWLPSRDMLWGGTYF